MVETHGFGAALVHFYKGQLVEINTGEHRTTHLMDQFEHNLQYFIKGVIKEVHGDGVLVEVTFPDGKKDETLINCWHIINVSPINEHSMSKHYWDADRKHQNK